jgi:hypothetical protein
MAYYNTPSGRVPYKSAAPSFKMTSSSSVEKPTNRMLEYGILFAVLALIGIFAYRANRR